MESKSKNKFFKGTFYVFIIKMLGAGLAFLTQVVISKAIGIEDYGSLSLFLSIANIMMVLPLIGMDTGIIRSVAAADEKSHKKWFLTITMKIATLLLALILAIVFVTRNALFEAFNLDVELSLYLMLYVIFIAYSKIMDGFLQGEHKTVVANIFNPLLNNLLKITVLAAVYTATRDLLTTVIVLLAVEMVLVIARFIYLAKGYMKVDPEPKGDVKGYVKYSLPLFFVASISILLLSLDKFILSYLMGNFEVGILKIFENYAAILALFVTPFVTLWPIMSEYYRKDKMDELKDLFKQSTLVIAALIMPAWITLTVSTEEMLGIFGVDASEIGNIRLIMFLFFLGTVYDAIIGPAGALLSMTKYSKINLYNNIALFVINIVLSFILISQIGLLGAAISFSASKIFINTLNVYQNKRLFNLFPYGKMHFLLIAAGIPVYYIGSWAKSFIDAGSIITIGTIGILSYILYLSFFIALNKESAKKLLIQIKKRKG
ncbi:oligosaccharide flippase family protein [Mesobacillus boroniphilus]|uniref:oligosaccharide flippase family protein n=1 Tax=Mesobacillus boroniphilus TaxID=308892 RepID=UPI001BCECA85|nr:oligosaccharide flippase family protein [Mesobacillus boroniphilus]